MKKSKLPSLQSVAVDNMNKSLKIMRSVFMRSSRYRDEVIIFGVAFAVRILASIAVFSLFADFPIGSSIEYRIEIARSIAEEGSFAYHGVTNTYQTPIYPAFLSILFIIGAYSCVGLVLLQSVVDSISAVMISRIANWLGGDGKVSSYIYVCYPMMIMHAISVVDTVLVVFLFVLSLERFLSYEQNGKKHNLLMSAIMIGLSILNRPIVGGLILGILMLILLKKDSRKWSVACIYIMLAAMPSIIWVYRNYVHTEDYPIIATGSGHFLWYSHNKYVREVWLSGKSPDIIGRDAGYEMYPNYVVKQFFTSPPKDQLKYDKAAKQHAKKYIVNNISDVIVYSIIKAEKYFTWGYILESKKEGLANWLRKSVSDIIGAPLYIFGYIGLLLLYYRDRKIMYVILLIMIVVAVGNIGYQFVNRHKVIHEVLLIALVGVTARQFREKKIWT